MRILFIIFGVILALNAQAQVGSASGVPLEFQIGGTTYATIGTNGVLSTINAVKLGTTVTCDGTTEGSLRYNSISKKVEVCDATAWGEMASANGASTDTTPNTFTFTDLTDQSLGALILSNTLTISGFDGPLLASISGAGTPEFQVNGGDWVTAASINPGDTVRLRLVSSTSVSTAYVPAITIGTVTDNWSVTTRAGALKAFKTAGWYNGNLGGLAGADAICQSEAANLGYAGTYKAILSDATTDAKTYLTLTYPIVRADTAATVEAIDLWAGSIDGAIGSSWYAWTGTNSDGTKHANTCSSWTSSSSAVTGRRGQPSTPNTSEWLSYGSSTCNLTRNLYCIQQ